MKINFSEIIRSLKDSFKVRHYKRIPIKKVLFRVTEEDIEQYFESSKRLFLYSNKWVESADGVVAAGRWVYVNIDVFDPNGDIVPKLSERNVRVEPKQRLYEYDYSPLRGAKKGDIIEYKQGFPKPFYQERVEGKEATLRVEILKVEENEPLPWVESDYLEYHRVKDLEEDKDLIRRILESRDEKRSEESVKQQIRKYLLEKNKFKVPQDIVNLTKKELIAFFRGHLNCKYCTPAYVEEQVSLNMNKFEIQAEELVRYLCIYEIICGKENILVSKEEIESDASALIGRLRTIDEDLRAYEYGFIPALEKFYLKSLKDEKFTNYRAEKKKGFYKFLIENAAITEEIRDK
ncbi:MAG: hypothetical protein FWH43_02855 [Endomicrobia bacterium]|nr:hypothetical protein [Endomicrobiia bacterium]